MALIYQIFEIFVVGVFCAALGGMIGGLIGFYIGRYMRLVRIGFVNEEDFGKEKIRKANTD